VNLLHMTVEELLGELSSDSPAPGGGSAAALAGAIAASLCEMVSRLTLGREKYRDTWPELEGAGTEARLLGARLRRLVDEDSAAFESVIAARRLSKSTEEEKAERDTAVQSAVSRAAHAPLSTLESLAALSSVALLAVEKGNPGCITDAGTAGEMIAAGARAASWNVRVNLPGLRDITARNRLAADSAAALATVAQTVERIRATVELRLTH
jgi:glutamate formiminotransferase/formiminotetrahydrofolate cyclodeaminase